jgi:hypothetical protein
MFYFLVYHDNTHTTDLQKLLDSVVQYGKDFNVIIYPKSEMEPEFVEKNKDILTLPRGGGYWLWKPYIIHSIMTNMEEGDILFYLDAKYYFTEDFTEWTKELLQNELVVFKNKPNEPVYFMKEWCKMDVIEQYDMKKKVFEEDAEDAWGGCILLRKTQFTYSFVKEWLEMCSFKNITDSPSVSKNSHLFREHRHDQSLLSILIHKYGIKMPYFERRYLQNSRIPYEIIQS